MSSETKDYTIFSGPKFIESIRSNGYKDTSYAVAEIVDNAIDAGAKHIQILCQDKQFNSDRRSVEKIAILDDGHGMNAIELRNALLFGDGNSGSNSSDIGKYGMGLPNSSVSQCRRVDVYSWQDSAEPICCHIDLDEVTAGKHKVQEPEQKQIPIWCKNAIKNFPKKSGTLVIWSKLDRCSWKRSKKVIEHSQFLIGRIYRNFLANKKITINMTSFISDDGEQVTKLDTKSMLPNDPMYLIAPSSTPDPWGSIAMFKPDTTSESFHDISYDGKKHRITVKYSLEKDELRSSKNNSIEPGNTPHGQHARKNQGISIMRANREIMLDDFGLPRDPRDRWWGVEVNIPNSLDVPLGLTNNKQQVDILLSILREVALTKDDSDDTDLNKAIEDEEDETVRNLYDLTKKITKNIRSMQKRIRVKRTGTRSPGYSGLETKLNKGIKNDIEEGNSGKSDKDRENKTDEELIEEITETLIDEGEEEGQARETADEWIKNHEKIIFETGSLEGNSFFTVISTGSVLRVKINENHMACNNLLYLTDQTKYQDLTDKERLKLTEEGLYLLLASWARYEEQIESDIERKQVQDIRYSWGKKLNNFLQFNEKLDSSAT